LEDRRACNGLGQGSCQIDHLYLLNESILTTTVIALLGRRLRLRGWMQIHLWVSSRACRSRSQSHHRFLEHLSMGPGPGSVRPLQSDQLHHHLGRVPLRPGDIQTCSWQMRLLV
jgi:hypothetical protein